MRLVGDSASTTKNAARTARFDSRAAETSIAGDGGRELDHVDNIYGMGVLHLQYPG